MTWDAASLAPAAALLLAGLVVGFAFGRGRAAAARRHARELAARLEQAQKQHELTIAELDAAKDVIQRREKEHDAYRERVTQHFSGAGERMRDLALQYRSVYEHLAAGAAGLCPEGLVGLEAGFDLLGARAGAAARSEAPAAPPLETDPDPPESL
jgi:uncharacterized membrane-anchored protein YhcB (DUF1043 family)